ncbi:MAG: stage III sporulation protein AF [Dorea sp.]|nr:stage III sporulation protein AF [Dorea sp.]
MFEHIDMWIRNLAYYLVMVTMLVQIVPGSEYKKYIRFFTGLVLVVMFLIPVLKIFGMNTNFQKYYDQAEYQEKLQELEESVLLPDEESEQNIEVEEIRIEE